MLFTDLLDRDTKSLQRCADLGNLGQALVHSVITCELSILFQ